MYVCLNVQKSIKAMTIIVVYLILLYRKLDGLVEGISSLTELNIAFNPCPAEPG